MLRKARFKCRSEKSTKLRIEPALRVLSEADISPKLFKLSFQA